MKKLIFFVILFLIPLAMANGDDDHTDDDNTEIVDEQIDLPPECEGLTEEECAEKLAEVEGIECAVVDEKCCVGDNCATFVVDCIEGSGPIFEGCNDNCEPIVKCEEPTDLEEETICPTHVPLVCGTDGVTYGNECEANRDGGVDIAYEGPCRDSTTTECPIDCECDPEGNIILCATEGLPETELTECPKDCNCDSEGNIILCAEEGLPDTTPRRL
tara:strand:+ start:257 stop:904 length:648 start_codon:yes stop_codon:yes gene_type:complete